MKKNVTIGLLLCMAGLLLMHRNLILPGLPMFLLGFYLTSRR